MRKYRLVKETHPVTNEIRYIIEYKTIFGKWWQASISYDENAVFDESQKELANKWFNFLSNGSKMKTEVTYAY